MSEVSFSTKLVTGIGILIFFAGLVVYVHPEFIMVPVAFIICTGGVGIIPLIASLLPVAFLFGGIGAYFLGYLFYAFKSAISSGEGVIGAISEIEKVEKPKRTRKSVLAISSYIRESLNAGYTVKRITMDLKIAGWSEEEIKTAYSMENVPTPNE